MKSSDHDIQISQNGYNLKNSQIKIIYNYYCRSHETIANFTAEEKEIVQKLRTLPRVLQKTVLIKITILNKIIISK